VHGGVKFYRGSPGAARSYVEADRSRVDDYYLAEGTGLAERYVATPTSKGVRLGVRDQERGIRAGGTLDGPAYERWVAGYDVETGAPKGRLRRDKHGLRFVEVVVNGPKTWSLAAELHPEIAAAYDAAQDKAASEIIGWLAEHATTRVGPRGRQVQVPVEQLEAAVVRHYTSRAGDPHRHLHLQINARVYAAGAWRGLHSVGVVDSIEAINGIGHAAVVCDPEFRRVLAAHGYTLDPKTGEVAQLTPYAGSFSARAGQITRNIDRYEAQWRSEHPDEEPGPTLRRAWDRRAWAQARPDKVVPESGAELRQRWVDELHQLGFTAPTVRVEHRPVRIGRVRRDAVVDLVLSRLGARRSSWNGADIRGEVERIIASAGIVAQAPVRRELVEDLTKRTVARCVPLLARDDICAEQFSTPPATSASTTGHTPPSKSPPTPSSVSPPRVCADRTCGPTAASRTSTDRRRWATSAIGTQAEYARIPWADGTLVATPELPTDDLVPSLLAASDVLGTGWFAAVAAEAGPGKTVAVVGDGAVGLLGVMAAQQLGAERIIVFSRHRNRQSLAREFGATDIIADRGDDGVARLKELTGGLGAHSVIEAVGTQESMVQAIRATRPGGHVGYVGVSHDVALPGDELFFSAVHLHGGPAPVRRFLPQLIDLIWNGEINPGKVFDLELPLDGAAEAYQAMDERRAIKVLLRP
jgi:conjugative relaxase-like TrwC/TraI family protein